MHTIIYKTTYNLPVWCLVKANVLNAIMQIKKKDEAGMGWKMVTRTWDHIGLGHGGQTGQSWPLRRSRHIAHPFLFSLGLLSLHAFFCSRFSRFSTFLASSNFSSNFQHLSTVLFSKDPSQGGWQLRTGLTNMSPSRVRKRYLSRHRWPYTKCTRRSGEVFVDFLNLRQELHVNGWARD